ncbi:MAG: decaprenyl-phosphate phosphoribosyltransferase [Clostridia bacterium]|nr:decaprenyl-phosphate phosphoribosyltransferase [Clostridia bacterium]
MKHYLKLMRVPHYVKNLLVFAALACSGQMFQPEKLLSCAIAFAAFCATSSAVYIINDIRDKDKDSKHPTKCHRPIACGAVSVKAAWVLAAVLLLIAVGCSLWLAHTTASLLLLTYLGINLAYSFGLKNIPILDVAILVAGFLIRVLYGAMVTDIVISNWLYFTVIAISFYLALGKRRNELKQVGSGDTRRVLTAYSIPFLDKSMGMFLTLTNVFYALWSVDENTVSFYDNRYLILTVPLVFLITLKYSLTIEKDSDGDPVEVLFHDKYLLLLCLFYLVTMMAILYL